MPWITITPRLLFQSSRRTEISSRACSLNHRNVWNFSNPFSVSVWPMSKEFHTVDTCGCHVEKWQQKKQSITSVLVTRVWCILRHCSPVWPKNIVYDCWCELAGCQWGHGVAQLLPEDEILKYFLISPVLSFFWNNFTQAGFCISLAEVE